MDDLRIDELAPGVASRSHFLASMDAGATVRLAISAILGLIDRADLPPDVESALALAESALQSIPNNAITTAKIQDASVTNSKLASMTQATVKGRASGAGSGAPGDLSAADLFSIVSGLVGPLPKTASGVGQIFDCNSVAAGAALALPAGGTWFYSVQRYNESTGAWAIPSGAPGGAAGIASGGTTIFSGLANVKFTGFAWRIS